MSDSRLVASDKKGATTHCLLFTSHGQWYALPAERAAEVLDVPSSRVGVPGGPVHVLGVFAHRGEVLPLVCMGKLRGTAEPGNEDRAVVLRTPQGAAALCADRVHGIEAVQCPTPEKDAWASEPAEHPLGPLVFLEPDRLFTFLARSGRS